MDTWTLAGYDTFSNEHYPYAEEFPTQAEAEAAAKVKMQEIEKLQPSRTSGGPSGIQDWVYVVRPDGSRYLHR